VKAGNRRGRAAESVDGAGVAAEEATGKEAMNKRATIYALLRHAAAQLSESDSAVLDAQLLLAEVLGKERVWLLAWGDRSVTAADERQFRALLARRQRGEPIAHILRQREFWSMELECDTSTLIPRPETELLVDWALQLDLPAAAQVLDLGTGTGAIALALAIERPDWRILAVDAVAEAVALAERNRRKFGLRNVRISESDWFAGLAADWAGEAGRTGGQEKPHFDLIVANPPYVAPASDCLQQGDLRFEPRRALVAAQGGMADIELICAQAGAYLRLSGWLLLEHGSTQAEAVAAGMQAGGFRQISCRQDLAGLPRYTGGQKYL